MTTTFVEVIRAFSGDHPYQPGEVLDASHWRNLSSLIERRYVRVTAPPLVVSEDIPPHEDALPVPLGSKSTKERP